MSKKVMRLVNPYTGLMECKVCGSSHVANIRPGSNGHYYRGSWQCIHGCRFECNISKEPKEGIMHTHHYMEDVKPRQV